jgi:hypothetical protein
MAAALNVVHLGPTQKQEKMQTSAHALQALFSGIKIKVCVIVDPVWP